MSRDTEQNATQNKIIHADRIPAEHNRATSSSHKERKNSVKEMMHHTVVGKCEASTLPPKKEKGISMNL